MSGESFESGSGIVATYSTFLERYVQIGFASNRAISVQFPIVYDDPDIDHSLLDRISDYLAGVDEDFTDVPIALTVSSDHRAVLETVRTIPYGTGVDTETLARMTPQLDEADEDQRIVRTALDGNPLPLLIPDHRVRDAPGGAPPVVEQRLRSLERL